MRLLRSARKHGFTDDDVKHVVANAIRYVEYEYDGEERLLIIGPSPNGQMLEVVAVPVESPNRIIHVDVLQPNRFHYLR